MTRIRLDEDTTIDIKRMGAKFKVILNAEPSLKDMISGDLSAIVTRKDLAHARDILTKLLEED